MGTKMSNLKDDIEKLLDNKLMGNVSTSINEENIDFFNELLNQDVNYFDDTFVEITIINLNKITEEEIITLHEYLDYINMIEGS